MVPGVNTKAIWSSKTIWVQALTLLSALIPAVQAWIAANPVEFVAVLAAVNVIARFLTSGAVSIFSDDPPTGPTQFAAWAMPWIAGGLIAASSFASIGCSDLRAVELKVYGIDATSGAKGGLTITGGKASIFGRIPIKDSNGLTIGSAEIFTPVPVVDHTGTK